MIGRKVNWPRIALLTAVAAGSVLTVLNVIALASRENKEAELLRLLDRCKGMGESAAEQATGGSPAGKPAASNPKPSKGATNPKTHAKPGARKPAKGSKKPKTRQDKQADRVCQRNIFSPPARKAGFKAVLIGVLGDQAIFQGGKMIPLGGTINGAKLTKIGPGWVEVVFEGKPKRLDIYSAPVAPPGRPGGRPRIMPRGMPVPSPGRPGPPPGAKPPRPAPSPPTPGAPVIIELNRARSSVVVTTQPTRR